MTLEVLPEKKGTTAKKENIQKPGDFSDFSGPRGGNCLNKEGIIKVSPPDRTNTKVFESFAFSTKTAFESFPRSLFKTFNKVKVKYRVFNWKQRWKC